MIDTHAHLDFKDFDEDREEIVQRAFDKGVKKIINVGVDLERSGKSIEIAEQHEGVFASVGLHPEFFSKLPHSFRGSTFPSASSADSSSSNLFEELKKLARNKKVVAIGETGLDYFSHTADPITLEQKNNQKRGFSAQIELAKKLNLPVIVHCRDAWEDLFKIISNLSKISAFPFASSADSSKPNFIKFVLHCYSGERKDTEKFLELPNVYFSFSGNITYPKPADREEKLAEAVRTIPLGRMMLDTDSPYLAPQEFRGKRNEPSNAWHIADKIAQIKGIGIEEVEKTTDKNAILFFGLG